MFEARIPAWLNTTALSISDEISIISSKAA